MVSQECFGRCWESGSTPKSSTGRSLPKMEPWYALHVAPNAERSVMDRLDQERIESYYPHTEAKSRDGKRVIQEKFFPGYLFARFKWSARFPVVSIPQVIGVLGWRQDCPFIIPDEEIEAVRIMAPDALPVTRARAASSRSPNRWINPVKSARSDTPSVSGQRSCSYYRRTCAGSSQSWMQ
jgi:hypothetical protein